MTTAKQNIIPVVPLAEILKNGFGIDAAWI